MPGILPMKVIKIGLGNQSRIAQACDRCRSKKIRCDGVTPSCSQCINVGFECKTSDKLSRRAFPRGYTESLEERVRALETEVRELKDLLDEKDEKLDMMSKVHANRRSSAAGASMSPATSMGSCDRRDSAVAREDTFRVVTPPSLLAADGAEAYWLGPSSGRPMIEWLKRKVQETGNPCVGFRAEAFLNVPYSHGSTQAISTSTSTVPPRLFTDRCVNIFFQEWAPLFPIIHKPSFLHLYEEYVADPEAMSTHHKLAELHLVFAIASSSSISSDKQSVALCERQSRKALDAVCRSSTIQTLQLLVLALLYSISKGDHKRIQTYRSAAVGLAHRLGLHQNQKRLGLHTLTTETRKKIFWSLYTIDCFAAAMLGLPRLLKDEDIDCEYPADVDDEYVTETGFSPTLPGEATKLSNALALFRLSRIFAKVLGQLYQISDIHELSLQQLSMLDSEIGDWSNELPPHLKLTFVQDKPSTNITGSRSAILSLAYYYIRSLIHRPAIGSTLGEKASTSVVTLANSSKHIIQIVQLLDERNMSFSFCLNRNELITLCGVSMLCQSLELSSKSSIVKDGNKLTRVVIALLKQWSAPGASDFQRLAVSLLPAEYLLTASSRRASDNDLPAPRNYALSISPSASQPLIEQAERRSIDLEILKAQQERAMAARNNLLQTSLSTQRHSPVAMPRSSSTSAKSKKSLPNLDYLSLSNTPATSQPQSPILSRTASSGCARTTNLNTCPITTQQASIPTPASKMSSVSTAEWESLISSLDNGPHANIYDAVYGGTAPNLSITNQIPSPSVSNHLSPSEMLAAGPPTSLSLASSNFAYNDWTSPSASSAWDMNSLTSLSTHDFDSSMGSKRAGSSVDPVAHSVASYSEESLASGDEESFQRASEEFFRQGCMSGVGVGVPGMDIFTLDSLDVTLGT